MKEISKKTKIITLLIIIVIVVGIIVITTKGLNFSLEYQQAKKIQLYLEKDFEITDMMQITNEVLPKQEVMLQKVEVYEDTVDIISKEITEEQKSEIINKVNEKYGLEISVENIKIVNVPSTRGRDIIKPYIMPFIIVTLVILVYMAIRYYKLESMKTIFTAGFLLVIAQVTLWSVIAILRIPIGKLTIPLVLLVYVVSLFGITTIFEQNLKQKKEEIEKEK